LVFIDESACNERTGDRKFGWSPVGVECKVSRPLKRSERWSILPALCNKGYMDWMIYQGAITADLFVEFLRERVLPYCTAYPGVRSVIIMDNASIHKDRRIQEACDEVGVLLKFLPPYSPDFNPIEATFKDLKAWVKKNYRRVEEFEEFSDFLEYAVAQNCKGDARGHFRTSGYIVRE
jgi:transposase